jgi:hypothetical protein
VKGNKEEVLGRANGILSFDTTRTAYKMKTLRETQKTR